MAKMHALKALQISSKAWSVTSVSCHKWAMEDLYREMMTNLSRNISKKDHPKRISNKSLVAKLQSSGAKPNHSIISRVSKLQSEKHGWIPRKNIYAVLLSRILPFHLTFSIVLLQNLNAKLTFRDPKLWNTITFAPILQDYVFWANDVSNLGGC